MGKIYVHEFLSVDGVYETPSWTAEYPFDPKMGEAIGAVMGACEGLLLGRRTYEMFAPSWAGRTAADDPGAPFMNDSTKYVVSSSLRDPEWRNSEVIGGYDAERIRALKGSLDGGLYVSGSGTLVRALLRDGLLDELHLLVYPVVLGAGERLFDDRAQRTKLELVSAEAFASGVQHVVYAPAG
jgi:dihydrofolate reductase